MPVINNLVTIDNLPETGNEKKIIKRIMQPGDLA
jgi:hypothetical protein